MVGLANVVLANQPPSALGDAIDEAVASSKLPAGWCWRLVLHGRCPGPTRPAGTRPLTPGRNSKECFVKLGPKITKEFCNQRQSD